MAKGIDVSKHQGKIDWTKVIANGVNFAILRAGYGKYENQKDECFDDNYAGAKAVGLPVGAYWYSYAKTVEDAKKEAEVFLKVISGKQFEYPLALDVEETEQSNKGKQFVSDVIRAFCEVLENAGYYVVVYANKYWYSTFIDDDCKKKYDTWVAEWNDKCSYTDSAVGIWQYTSDGVVNGISGRVDMNESNKDYSSIMKSNGFNGFSKSTVSTPTEQPTASATTSKTYVVKKGDTLSAIAKKFGTTYQKIASDNGIANPNLIFAGQKLVIK